jgi:hypothetical protein
MRFSPQRSSSPSESYVSEVVPLQVVKATRAEASDDQWWRPLLLLGAIALVVLVHWMILK